MIVSSICDSFLTELGQGLHNFAASGGDVFNCALYTNQASLGLGTTIYSVTNEVSGTGYSAGGAALTNNDPSLSNNTALYDFANLVFSSLTVNNIQGALIYNVTNGNRAVAVLNFGTIYSPVAQDLNITFPSVTSTTAIIRISNNG